MPEGLEVGASGGVELDADHTGNVGEPWPNAEVREVSLGENASRIRKGKGPEVMAASRNFAVGFLSTIGVTNIAEELRRNAARVDELFANLGVLKL